MIALADEVNEGMPHHVVDLVSRALAIQDRDLPSSRVLLLGITYKPNVSDTRVSPAMQIVQLLSERGAVVTYHDPFVPDYWQGEQQRVSVSLSDAVLAAADCVVIATNHASYDWEHIVRSASLVVDTRNATAGLPADWPGRTRVVRLGTPIEGAQ
jgi:UDP-N-acetyl-D-glucosamine dehydrogenase